MSTTQTAGREVDLGNRATARWRDFTIFQINVPNGPCFFFASMSYGGEQFQKVEQLDASVSVGDASGSKEVFAQMALEGVRDCTAIVLCRVYRTGENSWGVTNVSSPHPRAETARALVYTAQKDFQTNPPPTWGPLS
eukprot:Hpha_TRINITY_DN16763_c3_g1::TRINITY_DN16763_c3_g1_i2::g.79575::m.79575